MTYVWNGGTWQKGTDGKPIVVLFARDINTGEAKTIGIQNFQPYFYAKGYDGKNKVSCFGDPIKRVDVRLPSDVPVVKRNYPVTFEADVLYDMRYVIDNGLYYGFDLVDGKVIPVDIPTQAPLVFGFDIEVDSQPNEFPKADEAKFPVVFITIVVWKGSEILSKHILSTVGRTVTDYHTVFDDEQHLLQEFVDLIHTINPDVVGGWNSAKFDIPYLMNRMALYNIDVTKLTRRKFSKPTARHWTGRTLFDFLDYFKEWSKPMGKQESFRLKFIAKKFCDFSYDEQGAHIHQLIEEERWQDLSTYAFNDAYALYLIDQKVNLVGFFERLRQLLGVKLDDMLGKAKIIEYYLMHEGIKPMPTKTYDHDAKDYQGALVVSPPIGIVEWVGVTDLASLYPTIILAYNISPDVDFMIPKVLIKLMAERERLRAIKLAGNADNNVKTSEQSVKYTINSFYGYLGFSGARLYKPELADKVTGIGRQISLDIHKKLIELGCTLIYGDTDSTFFTTVRTAEEAKYIEEEINSFLLDWTKEKGLPEKYAPTVKLEKIYRTLLFKSKATKAPKRLWKPLKKPVESAKKRYVGHLVWKDGFVVDKLDYTGIEVKRSDTAPITRQCMEEFFDHVMLRDDIQSGLQTVRNYYTKILRGEVPATELSIPKGISDVEGLNGETIYTKGIAYGRQLFDINFSEDVKPRLLHLVGDHETLCIDENITDEQLECVTIDYKVMADKLIKSKMQSLVESIGYNWMAIEGIHLHETEGSPTTLFRDDTW